jgi:hypothetical protein
MFSYCIHKVENGGHRARECGIEWASQVLGTFYQGSLHLGTSPILVENLG